MNVLKIAGLILAIASSTHMVNFFIQGDMVIWTVTIPPILSLFIGLILGFLSFKLLSYK
jgi:hypothetical protein